MYYYFFDREGYKRNTGEKEKGMDVRDGQHGGTSKRVCRYTPLLDEIPGYSATSPLD